MEVGSGGGGAGRGGAGGLVAGGGKNAGRADANPAYTTKQGQAGEPHVGQVSRELAKRAQSGQALIEPRTGRIQT